MLANLWNVCIFQQALHILHLQENKVNQMAAQHVPGGRFQVWHYLCQLSVLSQQ